MNPLPRSHISLSEKQIIIALDKTITISLLQTFLAPKAKGIKSKRAISSFSITVSNLLAETVIESRQSEVVAVSLFNLFLSIRQSPGIVYWDYILSI